MQSGRRIAEFLLDIGAVKLSVQPPFTWTSGIQSPIYCDNRMLYSHPEARTFVVQSLADRVRNLHIPADVVAGTATAAIGWAALVADRLQLPFVYVRGKAKEHGTKKLIEGDLKPEQHVVLLEDLISTATSSVGSVETLREEGKAVVTDIVSIFSYGFESAMERAQSASVHLHPLTTFDVLLEVATEHGHIEDEDRASILEFARDPERWKPRVR